MGALLAFWLKGDVPKLTVGSRLFLGGAAAAGILVAGSFGLPYGPKCLFTYPLVALSCGTLLISILRPMSGAKQGKVTRVLVHLRRISYGLYVFHAFSLRFISERISIPSNHHLQSAIRWSSGLLLTILVAQCSYDFLELPFLRMKERFSRIQSAPPNAEEVHGAATPES